jgi:TPR repeat protein
VRVMPKPTSKLSLRGAGRRALHRRYEVAAEAGDAEAMLFIATVRAPEDPEAARVWFRRAAEAGNPHAMYIVALYLEASDPDASRMWLERASAKGGHRDAMVKLGVLSEQAGDLRQARQLYEQAANAGSTVGMFNLGLLQEKTDPTVARVWYEKAAAAGDADAMYNLGRMLEPDDPDAARAWWKRAAAAGQPEAQERL